MNPQIKIEKLDPTDTNTIIKIANWYHQEWGTPISKTIQRLSEQPNQETLFQIILTVENQLIATGGLCNEVNILNVHNKLSKYSPWIALLYTKEGHRNKGLGQMLLKQIELCAKELRLDKIYLYTFTAEALYKRKGWNTFERVIYKEHDTAVMEKEI